MDDTQLTHQILKCAYTVHTSLGLGLYESVYQICLVYELKKAGFIVEVEKEIPIVYDGIIMDRSFRADIIVNNKVLIELKSVDEITNKHKAQIINYLRLTKLPIGLLINFNEIHLKNGITRLFPQGKRT